MSREVYVPLEKLGILYCVTDLRLVTSFLIDTSYVEKDIFVYVPGLIP